MKQSIVINAAISDVFENIARASNREKWFLNVTSISYHNPNAESKPDAQFQLLAEEGNKKISLKGINRGYTYPSYFSFELHSDTYVMNFSYQLHTKGEQTLVEQAFETSYHNPLMNFFEKLTKGSTKQTGKLLLDNLKSFTESQ